MMSVEKNQLEVAVNAFDDSKVGVKCLLEWGVECSLMIYSKKFDSDSRRRILVELFDTPDSNKSFTPQLLNHR